MAENGKPNSKDRISKMADSGLRENIDSFTCSSETNALLFLIKSIIGQTVNTCIPVVVTGVERAGKGAGAGYLSCKPLVMQRAANGDSLPCVEIPRVPYFRLQHGTASIVCDPVVGDVGLAVFAKSDTSNVNGDGQEKQAGSFRAFDMSDGFYLGGFWGKAPTTFIHLEQDGSIEIESTKEVTVKTAQVKIEASNRYEITAPQIILNGAITGGGSGGATANFTGDVIAKNVSVATHTHGGIQPGNGNTQVPNSGS